MLDVAKLLSHDVHQVYRNVVVHSYTTGDEFPYHSKIDYFNRWWTPLYCPWPYLNGVPYLIPLK